MRLRKELEKRDTELLRKVEHLVNKATPQLWHSYGTFASGTSHTPEHTAQVENIAGKLLNDELIAEIEDHELALLILACHYHDLGMSGTEQDNLTEESRDRVRREHAVSVGDRILKHWRDLGFDNETTAEILAEVCKGHRPKRKDGIAVWKNIPERRILSSDKDVRVRLVAALVYAADELHIGEDRAPIREEEFLELTSPTSRLHWRRHQAIQGPVLRGNKLCFDATVATPIFENDLRKSLVKAFQAVGELGTQLETEGISEKPSVIELIWQRKKLWQLMIALACADLSPRTEDEIQDSVQELFEASVLTWTEVSSVCLNQDTKQTRTEQVSAEIDNWITRDFLKDTSDGLVLASDARTADHLFNIAKSADESERHFSEAGTSEHENKLYQSPFGQRFVKEVLKPELESKFSVDLTSPGHYSDLRTALESSPTAARIATLTPIPESVLVQYDLFRFACIAGVCSDLLNDPEKILDEGYRHSVDSLVNHAADRLPAFLLFIKELAIIKRLTYEQVFEATVGQKEIEKQQLAHSQVPEDQKVKFTLTQTFPVDRPEWSFCHLLLARSRAEITIAIKNSRLAPFTVTGLGDAEHDTEKSKNSEPSQIVIGQGRPVSPPATAFRGAVELDYDEKVLRLRCGKLQFHEASRPVLVRVSPQSRQSKEEQGRATFTFSFIQSAMTVQDSLNVAEAAKRIANDGWGLEVSVNENKLSQSDGISFDISEDDLELEKTLQAIDPNIPSPIFILEEDAKRLIKSDEAERQTVFDEVSQKYHAEKPTLTTIFLRYSTVDGKDYYEEYLGCPSHNFGFNPTIKCDNEEQAEEFSRQWKLGEVDIKLESSFREDSETLADNVREWSKETSAPLPFDFNPDLQFHYCRTRMAVVFHRLVDRLWYNERRVVFFFRPVLKSERYGVEMEYWKSQGDDSRARLLDELFQQASRTEAGSVESANSKAIKPETQDGDAVAEPDVSSTAR